MFRTGTTSVRVLQTVSVVASLAILMWSLGLPSLNIAKAATLTNVSDTLSDSDLGAASNHTISFTIPTTSAGVASTEEIGVTFAGFTVGTVDFSDIDLTINSVAQTLVAAGTEVDGEWDAEFVGTTLTFTSGGPAATASPGAVVEILIGTNATGGGANEQLVNPGGAGSNDITLTAGPDTGATIVVTLDDVDVTASVDTVFNFSVGGFNATGIDVNGTSTSATSSATEINFGELGTGNIVTAAQLLNVSTNAANGFVVTVQQSQDLRSATGADIDGFTNGEYTNTPINWASPSSTIGTESTYGHWGVTSSDDLNSAEFQSCTGSATGCWVAASTTARQVFENNGPADGSTANVGSTTIGYQVEIGTLQEAADDYSTTITYIATPTF